MPLRTSTPGFGKRPRSRWEAGFYRDAVKAAATRIFDVELPRKLGVQPSRNPADLFAAFAPDKTTGIVLRFKDIDPADATWASVHRGTMLVGQGCVAAIRNPPFTLLIRHHARIATPVRFQAVC